MFKTIRSLFNPISKINPTYVSPVDPENSNIVPPPLPEDRQDFASQVLRVIEALEPLDALMQSHELSRIQGATSEINHIRSQIRSGAKTLLSRGVINGIPERHYNLLYPRADRS